MPRTQQFDEEKWPDLTAFRGACLGSDVDTMSQIAAKGHDWYENENPGALDLSQLSRIFRAQHFAAQGDLASLRELVCRWPDVINLPWTAQAWRPLSQAVYAGHADVVEYLLANGADPKAEIGGPGQETTIAEAAGDSGNERVRYLLSQAIRDG